MVKSHQIRCAAEYSEIRALSDWKTPSKPSSMSGLSSFIAPLLLVLCGRGEATLFYDTVLPLPISSVGLGSPSPSTDPLTTLMMFPIALEPPINVIVVLETRKLCLVSCAACRPSM